MSCKPKSSRRQFLVRGAQAAGVATAMGLASTASAGERKRLVIDGMMHLENMGKYWDSMPEEVLEHYDAAGIDKGVIMAVWMPSRESNDWTLKAYKRHPDRFIPIGHVRYQDPEWKDELKRIAQPPFKGLKLHQHELTRDDAKLRDVAKEVIGTAAELGIPLVKVHLVDYGIIDELTKDISEMTWILPHLGCYGYWGQMQKFCELARNRKNVYLDTCAVAPYYEFGKAVQWAGADKITFATDGFVFSPMVEKAKIETLQLPTPYQTPRLTDEELDKILGLNMAKLLKLAPTS
jgi:predicted TIM-barrel fold metal-dependent hydrolase